MAKPANDIQVELNNFEHKIVNLLHEFNKQLTKEMAENKIEVLRELSNVKIDLNKYIAQLEVKFTWMLVKCAIGVIIGIPTIQNVFQYLGWKL